jgi:hypothetical protein
MDLAKLFIIFLVSLFPPDVGVWYVELGRAVVFLVFMLRTSGLAYTVDMGTGHCILVEYRLDTP